MFAILHKHGPAECPALNPQQLSRVGELWSDQTANSFGVKVIHRWLDVNCTSTVTGHLFGAPIHHAVFIVESERKENVQNFMNKTASMTPGEIVTVRSPSGQ